MPNPTVDFGSKGECTPILSALAAAHLTTIQSRLLHTGKSRLEVSTYLGYRFLPIILIGDETFGSPFLNTF